MAISRYSNNCLHFINVGQTLRNVGFVVRLVAQYNCISLGFTVGAVAAILAKHEVVASFLFCLALNHKQVISVLMKTTLFTSKYC